MKVLILAPVHVWDDVRVFKKLAVSLVGAGYEVVLIARIDKPDNKSGVTIIPPYGCYSNRLFRFLSLPLVALQCVLSGAEVYHLHNPDTLPIGIFLRLFRKKVIYDTHEDFSKRILIRDWLPYIFRGPVAWVVSRGEGFFAKFMNASIATQSDVAKRLGKNCIIIGNPPRTKKNLLDNVKQIALNKNIKKNCDFRLIYIGGIGATRGLFDMVDSMPIINKMVNCRLWLIGPSTETYLMQARKKTGWKYIDYYNRMPQENAFAYVFHSDVGLIYIQDVGGHSSSDPNKIYEYMAFSKPFIASDFQKWRNKLQPINAGVFVKPGNAELLAGSVIKLYESGKSNMMMMGSNGFKYVSVHNWENESGKLIKLYQKIQKT